jgi:hypothetical protein
MNPSSIISGPPSSRNGGHAHRCERLGAHRVHHRRAICTQLADQIPSGAPTRRRVNLRRRRLSLLSLRRLLDLFRCRPRWLCVLPAPRYLRGHRAVLRQCTGSKSPTLLLMWRLLACCCCSLSSGASARRRWLGFGCSRSRSCRCTTTTQPSTPAQPNRSSSGSSSSDGTCALGRPSHRVAAAVLWEWQQRQRPHLLLVVGSATTQQPSPCRHNAHKGQQRRRLRPRLRVTPATGAAARSKQEGARSQDQPAAGAQDWTFFPTCKGWGSEVLILRFQLEFRPPTTPLIIS